MKNIRIERVQFQLPILQPVKTNYRLLERETRALNIQGIHVSQFHDTIVVSSFSKLYTRIAKEVLKLTQLTKTI